METEALTYTQVDQGVMNTMRKPGKRYLGLLTICLVMVIIGAYTWYRQAQLGMGVTGLNNPVGWAIYITDFVFWVGIAHSGTLISAILYLLRAEWRTSVYRSAEAMTVFALMTAGLFPLIHLGRVWFFYWLLPYPNQRMLWPNFRSPLMWDVFAVSTYFTISILFLLLGMLPDLAALRNKGPWWRQTLYSVISLPWRGTARQWRHYKKAYLLMAAIATPLVVSVHSVVSWDFAMAILPGWHSTIFAPYFVAGAIHSGLAMVLTILIPLRKYAHWDTFIKLEHLDKLTQLILLTGLIMGYSYGFEYFIAWYSGNPFEQGTFFYRTFGAYAPQALAMLLFNSLVPLLFFIKRLRRNTTAMIIIAILINIGMWFERFVIVVGSLSYDYLPFNWGLYKFSATELLITAGSFSWFFLLFLIFIKVFPAVSITETKEDLPAPMRGSNGNG
jgi:molybdopterin-containing oxidoreductase family membrane subunit